MQRWTPRLAAALFATLLLAAPAAADPAPSRVLVRFASSAGAADRGAARAAVDGTLAERLPLVAGLQAVDLPPDASPTRAAAELERRPGVLYAEPDTAMELLRTVNDPLFGSQWALDNTGQTVVVPGIADADVDAPEAWDTTLGDPSVVVADIDTGGAWDHPDLAPNVWTNAAEAGGVAGVDDDGNGKVDDIRGWDFFSGDNDPSDFSGHGTGTASIIAARGDNGTGMTGMAPNARVMILRAGSATILVSAAVQAVAYARANGARVVNMSFGSAGESSSLRDAINASPGVVFVAAAGNDGDDVDANPVFPCATAAPNLVCVGATTSSDTLASFSNRGAANVDLAAPGQFIRNLKPAVRQLFSDGFSTDIAGRWTVTPAWGRFQTAAGPPPDFSLATNDPATTYGSGANSTAQRVGTFDTSGAVRECQVAFGLKIDTGGDSGDILRSQSASDGATFTTLGLGLTGTGASTVVRSLPLGVPTLSFRFRFTSDADATVSSGAEVDDVAASCLKTIGTYDGSEIGLSSGTSESAPLVSGAVALLLAVQPSLTPAVVRQRLIDTADTLTALTGTSVSGGRLNARRLLSGETTPPPSPTPPPPAPPVVQPTPLPPLVRDLQAPRLSLLSLSKVRFKAGKKTKVTFRLDEAAALVITSERLVDGRKVKGSCVKPAKKNKKAKRCGRWVPDKGSIAKLVPAGKGSITFKGRFGDRTLKAGAHRLRVRATDAAGNAANGPALSFVLSR